MNREKNTPEFDLHLFDAGEGAPAAPAADGAEIAETADANGSDGPSDAFDGGDPADDTGSATAESPEERASRYKKFCEEFRSELNEDHTRAMKKELGRRLRGKERTENELKKANETLDYARKLFGAKDLDELDRKLRSDSMVKSRRAAELGLSDEAYDRYVELELKAEAADNQRKLEEMRSAAAELDAAEEALREEFPDFNIDELRQNEDFVEMLKVGVPMRNAYLALNFDREVDARTAKRAAEAAEAQRQRRSRPRENAGGGKSGRAVRDVSKLTAKECEEMERRAMLGERVFL